MLLAYNRYSNKTCATKRQHYERERNSENTELMQLRHDNLLGKSSGVSRIAGRVSTHLLRSRSRDWEPQSQQHRSSTSTSTRFSCLRSALAAMIVTQRSYKCSYWGERTTHVAPRDRTRRKVNVRVVIVAWKSTNSIQFNFKQHVQFVLFHSFDRGDIFRPWNSIISADCRCVSLSYLFLWWSSFSIDIWWLFVLNHYHWKRQSRQLNGCYIYC